MTARGMAPSQIIRAIREAPATSFDLDPEVVAEMRAAGVIDAIIEVMTQVQRDRSSASQTAPAATEGTIDLIFESEPGSAKAAALRLPPVEIAFYLLCLDPTHVPDYWQGKTPLTEGFPRHHLLWFQQAPPREEADGRGKAPPPRPLLFPGPTTIRAEAGDHPIEVGLAVRDDKKIWQPLAAAQATIQIKPAESTRLVVRASLVKAPGKPPVALQIVEPPQPPAPDPADIKR